MDHDHETFIHESYQVHNCEIMGTADILQADIQGNSLICLFKRWWFDLFLVSKFHETSRDLFISSHDLKMERLRQFKKFRGKIHPLSKFRKFWEMFMLLVFVAHIMLFNINTSLLYADYSIDEFFDVILEIFIILDVIVNSQTAYIDSETRKVVFETKLVLLNYFSTKVFFHVASAIPLQCIMFFRYGKDFNCALCKLNKFIMTLKIISVLHIARLFEYSACMLRDRKTPTRTLIVRLARAGVLTLLTIMIFRELCDNIHLNLISKSSDINANSRAMKLLLNKFAHNMTDYRSNLALDINRIVKSFFLYSYHISSGLYTEEVIVSMLSFLISNIYYLGFINEFYSYIAKTMYPVDTIMWAENMVLNMAKSRHLPDHVAKKIKKYFDFKLTKIKVFDNKNCHFNSLPLVLRKEAYNICYRKYIKTIPYFASWPAILINELVMLTKEEIYLKNALVAEPWVEADGLTIVAYGELAVYTNDEETGHLIDGDYFGELSLVTDQELRISTVISITPCLILVLNKTLFRQKMREYPSLFYEMKKELKKKFVQRVSASAAENY